MMLIKLDLASYVIRGCTAAGARRNPRKKSSWKIDDMPDGKTKKKLGKKSVMGEEAAATGADYAPASSLEMKAKKKKEKKKNTTIARAGNYDSGAPSKKKTKKESEEKAAAAAAAAVSSSPSLLRKKKDEEEGE
jgi:hypothetical protein